MKRFFYLITTISTFLISSQSISQNNFFDFENYSAGQLLACQDPVNWTTFNLLPCDTIEDAYVSTNYANSGINSIVILPGTDLIKPLGNLTTGKWHISFDVLIPGNKAGYFNLFAQFNPPVYEWGLEVYFNDGGTASVNAGGTNSAFFAFPYDTWFHIETMVDLDLDQAELLINDTQLIAWQWTLGSSGNGCSLMLGAVEFFGAFPNNEMYIDNFWFRESPAHTDSHSDLPVAIKLWQNYPNPFNPSTTIKFSVPESGNIKLAVYNTVGEEIAVLANGYIESGIHEVSFNVLNLPSGVYLYKLQSINSVQTKKMLLLK